MVAQILSGFFKAVPAITSAPKLGRQSVKSPALVGLALVAGLLSGCGYNDIQMLDEGTKASWAEVLNQYQRRADLIPNLVQTVKGYASHEEKVFIDVAEARASVGSIKATPELVNDQASMDAFVAAQSKMTGALSRLMVVAENYPQLKADASFRDLQAQLEGTENRVTVARNRYIESVRAFNLKVRQFPSNLTAMVFKYAQKAQFNVSNEAAINNAPAVNFDAAPATTPTPPASAPAAPVTTP